MLKKSFVLFVTGFLFLILNSCEVGLGASVDVSAPVVEISSPADGSVIMNTFTMSGISYDDTMVAAIKVTVQSTSDSRIYASYFANLNSATRQWSVYINNKKTLENGDVQYELPDGEYTFTVTSIDSAGRSTEKSRVYKIDNTPPVVVLKRPGLEDKFGRTLKLTGDIADINTLDSLYFTVYRKNGAGALEKIRTIKKSNISGVGLEVIVGKQFDNPVTEADKALNEIYKEFHSGDGMSDKLFCTVEVSDSAKEYNPPASAIIKPAGGTYTDSVVTGNLSTSYYLNDVIYDKIYSDNGYKLMNSDIVAIMSGKYADKPVADEVKAYLKENCVHTAGELEAGKISSFTLNPKNNPYYEVSGYKYNGNTFDPIANDAPISVRIYQGPDNIALDSKSISLSVQECDDSGEIIEGSKKIYIIRPDDDSAESIGKLPELSDDEKEEKRKERNSVLKIDDSIQIDVNIGNLSPKNNYLVIAEGYDRNKSEIESHNENLYGFNVTSVNKPPVIEITSGPEDLSAVKKVDFDFEGIVTIYAETAELFYFVSAKDEKGSVIYESEERKVSEEDFVKVDSQYKWKLHLDDAALKDMGLGIDKTPVDALYLYTVNFRAEDSDGNDSSLYSRRVHVDTDKPKFGTVSVSPYFELKSIDEAGESVEVPVVNGKVKISVTVGDNYELEKTRCIIYREADKSDKENKKLFPKKVGEKDSFTGFNGNFEFNTEEDSFGSSEDDAVIVEFISTDAVGNVASKTYKMIVNQETDKPVINVTNADELLKDDTKIKKGTNLFDQTGNNKLFAIVTDDDNVYSITLEYITKDDYENERFEKYVEFYSKDGIETTSYAISEPLCKGKAAKGSEKPEDSLDEGIYYVRFTATDKDGNSKTSQEEFCVGVDAGAPEITLLTPSGSFVKENDSFEVSGTVSDSSGIVKIYKNEIREENLVYDSVSAGVDAAEKQNWTYSLETGSYSATVYFIAEDKYGNSRKKDFSYKIDTVYPTKAPDWSDSYNSAEWKNNGTMQFNIPVSDSWDDTEKKILSDASGIKSVEIKYSSDGGITDKTESMVIGAPYGKGHFGDQYYNYNLTTLFADGEYSYDLIVKDNAGHETKITKAGTIKVDTTSPVCGEISAKLGGNAETNLNLSEINNLGAKPFVVKAEITDALSGIASVELYDGETVVSAANYTKNSSENVYSFSLKAAALTTGKHSFKIKAVDNAGNEKFTSVKEISVDATKPGIEISDYSPAVTVGSVKKVNSKITIKGTATDETKLGNKIKWNITGAQSLSGTADVSGNTYSTWETDEIPLENFADGDYTLSVTSIDAAGNESAPVKETIHIDHSTDKPVVTATNASVIANVGEINSTKNMFGTTSNNKMSFSVTDDKGLTSPVVVKAYSVKDDDLVDTKNIVVTEGRTSANVSYNLPSAEGEYKIVISVKDQEWKTSADDAHHTNDSSIVYYVAVDSGEPEISLVTPNGAFRKENETFDVTVKVKDSSKKVTVYKNITTSLSGATKLSAFENADTEKTLNHSVTSGSSGESFYFIAEDKYGNTKAVNFAYIVDTIEPTAAPGWIDTYSSVSWKNSGTVQFSVPVSDEWNISSGSILTESSGIKEVVLEVIPKSRAVSKENFILGAPYATGSYGNKYYSYNLTKIFDDGEYDYNIVLEDNAGNKAVVTSAGKIKVDSTAPVCGEISAKLDNVSVIKLNKLQIEALAGKPFVISASCRDEMSGIASVELYDGETVVPAADYTKTSSGDVYSFSMKAAALTTGKHSFKIKAVDNAGNEKFTSVQEISVDATIPSVQISGVSPIVTVSDAQKVNSYIYVTGSATDETQLGSILSWEITGTELSGTASVDDKTYSTWKTDKISLEELSDGNYLFSVTVTDKAGNTSAAVNHSLSVDHSTDKPVVTATNASVIADAGLINSTTNLFGIASNNKLALTITDDKGLASPVVIKAYPAAGGEAVDTKEIAVAEGKTSANVSYVLPADEGKYKIVISVKDLEWESADDEHHANDDSIVYYVGVDAGNPKFAFTTPSGSYKSYDAFEVSGTVQDSSGSVTIERYNYVNKKNGSRSETPAWSTTVSGTEDTKNWIDDTITKAELDSTGGNFYYVAKDIYGNPTDLIFNYKIDMINPTVAADFTWTGGTDSWTNTTTYTYKIPVSDSWDKSGNKKFDESSGIQSVTIYVKGDGESEFTGSVMSLGSVYKGADGKQSGYCGNEYYTYTSTQALTDGGATKVKFVILDNAGNSYNSSELTYKIDSTAPGFGSVTASPAGITAVQYDNYTGANIFTITLPVIEEGSGIKSIEIDDNKTKLDNVSVITDSRAGYTISPAVTEGAKSQTYTIKFTKAAVETGQHSFNIKVTDVAGNVNTYSQSLSSDSNPPEISVSGVTPVYNAETNTVNGTITVKGFVSDDAKLASLAGTAPAYTDGAVKWELKNSSSAVVKSGVISTVNGGISASWAAEIDTTEIPDGAYTFVITAKDAAGNVNKEPEEISLIVSQETDRPEISLTSANASYKTPASIIADTNNTNVLAQGAKLTGLIEDDDGIKTVKVSYRTFGAGEYTTEQLVSDGTSTTYSLNYTLPSVEGAYEIKLEIADTAGNETYGKKEMVFCVAIDAGSPVWTDFAPANGTFNRENVAVSANVSDGSGEISVYASILPAGATSTHGTAGTAWSVSAVNGSFTDTVGISSLADETSSGYTVEYTAKDKWGQESTRQFTFYKDATAPAWIDANSKVGGIASIAAVESSWFKSEALTVEGELTEAGSGVQSIYYWVKRNYDDIVTLSTDTATATGSFAATNNKSAQKATYKAAIDNFADYIVKDNLNNDDPSWAVLYLIAEDAAGNKAFNSYNIKVDTTAPEVSGGSSSTLLTNRISPLTVTGSCADEQSGISSVSIKVGSNEIAANLNAAKTEWSVEIPVEKIATGNIYATAINNAQNKTTAAVGAINVDDVAPIVSFAKSEIITYASGINGSKAVDGAVTETNPLKLELWYSKTGAATLSASATPDTAGWTKFYETAVASEIYNFTTNNADGSTYKKLLNFNEASGAENAVDGKGTLYILPVVYDVANNCSVHGTQTVADFTKIANFYQKFTVDMNSDRPVLRMNELASASGTIRKYTTNITGMINDDDGVSEFYVTSGYTYKVVDGNVVKDKQLDFSTTEKALASWEAYKTYFDAKTADEKNEILEWTSNGSFMYTPEDSEDGEHPLYFYIKDGEGSIFFTGKSAATGADVYRPYLRYKNSRIDVDNSAAISYKTDSNPPTVEGIGYSYAPYTSGSTSSSRASGAYSEYTDSIPQSFVLGGLKKAYVKFRIIPYDALGIESVTGKIGNTINVTFTEGALVPGGSGTKYWESNPIELGNLSSIPTSSYPLNIVITDISKLTTVVQRNIALDNTIPVVDPPSPTAMQTGTFTVRGTTSDVNGVETLKYLVMKDEYSDKTDSELIEIIEAIENQYNDGTALAYDYTFDGSEDGHPGKRNPVFPATAAELLDYSNYKRGDTDLYDIPLYFLAEDSLGNKNLYKDYKVYYNPYSDRPIISSIYSPGEAETVSGTIRISGGASDNTAVGSVYIQIDTDKSGSFTFADMTTLMDLGYLVYASPSVYSNAAYASYKTSGKLNPLPSINGKDAQLEADSNFWGVKCSGAESWYVLVNNSSELQIEAIKTVDGTENIYNLSTRAAAFDENNLLGAWSDKRSFMINPNAPAFGSTVTPHVAQFAAGDTALATETASKSYTDISTSYVNGIWYLVTSVEHSSGVKSVTYTLNDGSPVTLVSDSTSKNAVHAKALTGGKNGWTLKIPVTEASGEGVNNLIITAAEAGQGKTSTANYSVRYDNEAPVIEALKANDADWTSGTKLMNSNNSLTIGSTINDGTAGMGKVLFYFYRNYGGVKRLYDVGMDVGNALSGYKYSFAKGGKTYAGIDASALETNAINLGTSEKLYGAKVTVSRSSTTSVTLPEKDEHIRAGSVVQLGSSWHKVTNVAADGLTLTITPASDEAQVQAFFPYAMAVDNFSPEKIKSFTSDGAIITGDDGDGMWESISGGDTSRIWQASIHANWMPDGPVTFVLFAFDKADNVSATSITCTLETSGPRLAKLHIGTDLNRNGSYKSNEFETYNFLGVEGEYQDAYALTTKAYDKVVGEQSVKSDRGAFKIKNNLAIVPEFVGGNGDIYAVLNNNDTTTTVDSKGFIDNPGYAKTTVKGGATEYAAGKLNPVSGTISDSGKALDGMKYWQFTALGADSTSETDYKKMSFTFWDSTDGLTTGENSQKCFVSVRDFIVMQNDNIAPKAVTEKFYWNSESDNSLYNYSKNNGHIELEADLTDAIKNSYGTDPKVSGKIVLHGTAYDENFLSKLSFSFTNFGSSTTTPLQFAEYDEANNEWKASGSNTIGAQYFEYVDVQDEYFGQEGHKVSWKVAVDTAHITGVTGTDLKFTVYATDKANNKSVTAVSGTKESADSVYNNPVYQMDVVPYITGVSTRLDDAYTANTSVFNRSANGKYPVRQGETNVKILGFNLKSGTTAPTVKLNSNSGNNYFTVTASSASEITGTIGTAAASGEIEVTVNSVSSLNNKNADTEYNREPNKINNNTLKDDRNLWVWRTTQVVTDGTVRYPSFRIGKDSNQTLGFTYDSGAQSYKMYSSATATTNNDFVVDYSFTQWYHTAVAIDKNGKIYGVSQNGDSGGTGEQTYDGNYANSYFYGWNTKASPDSVRIYNSTYRRYYDKNPNGQSYSAYSTGTKKVAIESTWNGEIFNGERVKNPKIATGSEGKCYLVYYDSSDEKITFRYGTVSGSNDSPTFSGALVNHGTSRGSATGAQTIASGTSAGEYSAVGVIPDGVTGAGTVVVCWYDTSAHALKYKYNTNPSGTTWSTEETIDSDYAGEICDLAVDPDGGIHVAYFRAGGRLKYAYLSSYNAAKADVCTVDSYLSVGTNISIEVSSDKKTVTKSDGTTTTRYIPYISYFTDALKLAKVAWPVTTGKNETSGETETFNDGVATDQFTGSWEVQCIPTPLTTTLLNYSVGVGVKTNGRANSVMLGYGTKAGLETALLN